MKKSVKIILIILGVLVGIVLIDTIQAKVFDNNPILKIVENYNGGELYQKHKGIMVDTYIRTDGTKTTIFKWEKYSSVMKEKETKNDRIPNDYISVFHSESGDIIYETYIYKILNVEDNQGFNYVNVTKTLNGKNQWNTEVTHHGSVAWTDQVFEVAEENNAYSYVTLPNSEKKYTIEEYKTMFLMD